MRQESGEQNPTFQTAEVAVDRQAQHCERDQNHQRDFLPQYGALRGRVEDAETLTPIKEFQIVGVERKSFYSKDGTFELKGLTPGRQTFAAQAPGYQMAELADVVIRVGEPTEVVVFSLTKGVELSGRVVDGETGAGEPNITVGYLLTSQAERHTWNLHFRPDGLLSGKFTG